MKVGLPNVCLASTGELFVFGSLGVVIKAVNKGSDVTLSKGDVNVTLNNPDEKDEDE